MIFLYNSKAPKLIFSRLRIASSWRKDIRGVILWVCQENFSLTRLKFSLKMFFVTKKVLINTKVFCNVSNPLNLRYNKQTKCCSYIRKWSKNNFRPLQGKSLSNSTFNENSMNLNSLYFTFWSAKNILEPSRDIIKVSKRYNYSATSRVIHLGTSFLAEKTNKHPDICIYLCKWVREDEHNL